MLLALLFSSFGFAANLQPGNLACQAIYRTLDEHNHGIEENVALKLEQSGAGAFRLEGELRGKFFSVTADVSGDLLVQITTAPDYTKGSVSKGQLDSLGRFSLSEVSGATVHRLECRRL